MIEKIQELYILFLFNQLRDVAGLRAHKQREQQLSNRLVKIGVPAGVCLSWYCGKSQEELAKSKIAHQIINSIGEPMVEPLIDLLDHKDPDIQIGAIYAFLGFLKDPRIVDPLLKCLSSRLPEIRKSAITILQFTRNDKIIKPAIDLLADEHSEVRAKAAKALYWFKSSASVEPLLSRLTDPNEDKRVRIEAVSAVGQTKDSRAVDPLIELLSHKEWELRARAALALSQIGDRRALPLIRAMLKDKNKKVRKDVKYALANYDSDRRKDGADYLT